MKLVSKKWQEVKDDKHVTEMYEYLSLRDREAYSELKKYWDKISNSDTILKPQKAERAKRKRSFDDNEEVEAVKPQKKR